MSETSIPRTLVDSLKRARHVVVMTGAGISAESKIPTFRDAQTGLWAKYRPEELATPEAFRANPKLVWDWYSWRRSLVSTAKPNPGHHALAALQHKVPRLTLITQNVDGLHQRAGSDDVVELHGNLNLTKCFEEDTSIDRVPESDQVPPRCPNCGGHLRPGVVWFGEALPVTALERASRAAANCDLFFSIGTSAVVYPAAGFVLEALRAGAETVEINPMATPQSKLLTHTLRGPAGKILPELLAKL